MEEFSLAVPVDTATLLVVDPCHLSPDLVEKLLTPGNRGFPLAALVPTMWGQCRSDGWYVVGAVAVDGPDDPDAYLEELFEWQELDSSVQERLKDPAYLRALAAYIETHRSRHGAE